MNAPKKPLVQIRRGSEKLPAKPSSPQPAGIDFQTGVVRSVSSWMRMTKINMEGENSGESDYARAEREQTKLQLHNITKRLCEVIERFDDGRTHITKEEKQGERDAMMKEREDFMTMVEDYDNVCVGRKAVLESLDDWFKEGHIDEVDDMWEKAKKMSNADDFFLLRQSLLVGKLASVRLRAVYAELEKGSKRVANNLKAEKQKLEEEVQVTKQTIENIIDKKATDKKDKIPDSKSVSDMVKETWKYAAAEICDMLNRVKDHAGDTKALETQINKMVASMNQQSDVINQLNKRIKELEEIIRTRDQTASSLSDDNTQLKEGMDVLRGEVLKVKKQAAVLQTQLEQTEQEKGAALKKVAELSSKDKQAQSKKTTAGGKKVESDKDEGTSESTSTETLKALISDLTKKNTKLEQDNSAIKTACDTLQNKLEVTVKKLEGERDQFKAELELITQSSPVPAESRSLSSNSGIRSRASNKSKRGSPAGHNAGSWRGSPPTAKLTAQMDDNEGISEEKVREIQDEVHKQTLAKEQLEKVAESKLKEAQDELLHFKELASHLQEELEAERGFNVTEESKEHFEEKTLEMVADLLRKLNSDNHQLEIADSKALRRLQEEAIKINNVIESFMAYSSKVLNEEAAVMSIAVETLLNQLPPSERDEILNRSQVDLLVHVPDHTPPSHTPQDYTQTSESNQLKPMISLPVGPSVGQPDPLHMLGSSEPSQPHMSLLHLLASQPEAEIGPEQPGTGGNPTSDNNPFNNFLSSILGNSLDPTQRSQTSPFQPVAQRTTSSYQHASDQVLLNAFDGIVDNLLCKRADFVQQLTSMQPVVTMSTAGTLENQGTAGTLENQGTAGTLENQGTAGTLENQGTAGTLENQGTAGTLENQGTAGTLENQGTAGTLENQGTAGTLENKGAVGTLENKGAAGTPKQTHLLHISSMGMPNPRQQLKNYANQAMEVLANYGAEVLSPNLKLQQNKLRRVLNAMAQHKTSKGPGYKFPEMSIPENMTKLLQVQNYAQPGEPQQQLQNSMKLSTGGKRRGAFPAIVRKRFPLQDLSEKINQVHYLKDQNQMPSLFQAQPNEEPGVSITKFDLTQPSNSSSPSPSPWITNSSLQHVRKLPGPLQHLQERQGRSPLPPPQTPASKLASQMTSFQLQTMTVPNIVQQTVLKTSKQPATTTQAFTRRRRENTTTALPPTIPTPSEVDTLEKRGDIIDYLISELPLSVPRRAGKKMTHKSLFWSRRRHTHPNDREKRKKAPIPGSVMYKIPPDYVDIY